MDGHKYIIYIWGNISVGALANVITGGIIVTGHKNIATVTNNASTSDSPRVPPHNLRVVAAHLTILACVCGIFIVLFFIRPGPHCVAGCPGIPVSPVYILPQLELPFRERMLRLAVLSPLPCPPFRVVLQVPIPHQWPLPLGCPHQIVGVQEFQRLGNAAPAQLLGNAVYGLIVWDFPATLRRRI